MLPHWGDHMFVLFHPWTTTRASLYSCHWQNLGLAPLQKYVFLLRWHLYAFFLRSSLGHIMRSIFPDWRILLSCRVYWSAQGHGRWLTDGCQHVHLQRATFPSLRIDHDFRLHSEGKYRSKSFYGNGWFMFGNIYFGRQQVLPGVIRINFLTL